MAALTAYELQSTTSLRHTLAGEDQEKEVIKTEQRYLYAHVDSNATTTIENATFLHAIVVNTAAAGSITIYDNTSAEGTVVAILKASVAEGTYTYNAALGAGLTVVTAHADQDITIIYRT